MRNASVTWLGALVGLGLGATTGQPALAAENLRLCTGSPGKAYIKVGQQFLEAHPDSPAADAAFDALVDRVLSAGGREAVRGIAVDIY